MEQQLSNIIEHSDSGNERTIRVGDSRLSVSIKDYQAIYHQVTGRTEQIRKRFPEHLLITLEEIVQLNYKILQLREVHTVVADNTVVSLFHEKERKEQFTSFERFLKYNSGAISPTVNIVIKYNFSIIPGELERAQEYVVTVRLTSRVAVMRELASENIPGGPYLFRLMGASPAEITIDYVDYVIARNFLGAFEEWVKGCDASPRLPWLEALQRRSHFIPIAAQLLTAGLITWFALGAIPAFFADNFIEGMWARFFVIYIGGAYILISLAGMMGNFLEGAIDGYPILSYLNLNRGDEKLINEFKSRRQKSIVKILLSWAVLIGLGVISSKLAIFV